MTSKRRTPSMKPAQAMGLALAAGLYFAWSSVYGSDVPDYAVNDTFVYDNGRVERVVAVEDEDIVWANRSGRQYVRKNSFFTPILSWESRSIEGERRLRGAYALWPLETGRSVQFTAISSITEKESGKKRRSVQRWQCRIEKPQTVSVPAGEFETTPIKCASLSRSTLRILSERTWYYAPDVGHYVKQRRTNFLTGVTSEFALAATLEGRMANSARIKAILNSLDKD